MLTLQSILVYGFMIWVMTYNANRILKRRFIPQSFIQFITDKNYVIPIIIFCFFASIRWGVGVDCNSYMEDFYDWGIDRREEGKGEWIFLYTREFFRGLHLSHVPFFFVLALMQIGFIYYGLRDKPWILFFFPLMLFLCGEYWMWMNGVRQSIVCCMFVYIINLQVNRKWILSIAWIIIACLMHRSALVLLPLSLFCLYPKILIPNRWIQISIVVACYVAMGLSVTDSLAELIEMTLALVGYEEGSQEHMIETIMDKKFGFRSFLLLFANCITIFFSTKMRDFYKSSHFNVMYNLYFIGVCAALVFYGNHGIERILMYLTCFTPIMLSCCAYYLYKHRRGGLKGFILISLIGTLLMRTLYDLYSARGNKDERIFYKTILTHKIPSSGSFL